MLMCLPVLAVVSPRFMADSGEDASLSVSKQVLQNSTFSLRCPALAVPAPEITWYKNGHLIDPLDSPRIQSVNIPD